LEPDLRRIKNLEAFCKGKLEVPWDSLVGAHLECYLALCNKQYTEASKWQSSVAAIFQKIFEEAAEVIWALPVLHVIVVDLRVIARHADRELKAAGAEVGRLNESVIELRKFFKIAVTDRSPLPTSKKWGTLHIINNLFKIYFELKNLSLCKHLIKTVEGQGFPELDRFPVSQLVTYRFYVGYV